MTERTLTDAQIERLGEIVEPEWTVERASLTDSGHHAVYHLDVQTGDSSCQCVLKAMPPDGGHGVAAEARVQALLADHTSIPVPDVIGAVDDVASGDGGAERDAVRTASVPTPAYLMETMPGEPLSRDDLGDIGESPVREIARQLGGYLAQLHRLDVVSSFGVVAPTAEPRLWGDRPPADGSTMHVVASRDWPTTLSGWIERELDGLADSRFADCHEEVAPALRERAAAVSGPFRPALGHVDASVENHLWDDERETVTAVLDWGFTVAATPAYDLSCVAHSLGGGHWAFLPDTPDYRESVREPLIEGYRATFDERTAGSGQIDRRTAGSGRADWTGESGRANEMESDTGGVANEGAGSDRLDADRVADQFHDHWDCYGLLSVVRTMVLFDWYETRGIGSDRREAAAERLREVATAWATAPSGRSDPSRRVRPARCRGSRQLDRLGRTRTRPRRGPAPCVPVPR